jgi:hypothetical protein
MKTKHGLVCFPVLTVLLMPAFLAGAPRGDYGDAPDNGPTYYRMMFETSAATGRFPTLYGTSNSRYGNPGIHHLQTDQEWFGPLNLPPSRETDANDVTTDEDIYDNLINDDLRDNGLPKIPFFIALTQLPPAAVLSYQVAVPAGAPDVPRYVNVLIDWDQDGQWKQSLVPGAITEWVIRNHTINLAPGTSALFTSPAFLWGWNALLGPQCFWLRMTISQVPLEPSSYPDGWDGSGAFPTGETEDFLFHPDVPRDVIGQWTPPGNPQKPHRPRKRPQTGSSATGGAGPAVPPLPPPPPPPPAGAKRPRPALAPDLVIMPSDQTVPHTTSARAHVVKVPSSAPNPALPSWQVGIGFRNGGISAGSPPLPTTDGTFFPFGAPVQYAVWGSAAPGAPAGTLKTIVVNSVNDARSPSTEDWPLEVRAVFPGNLARMATGIVRVRHSEPLAPGITVGPGIPGIYQHGWQTTDWSVIAEPQKSTVLALLESSRLAFESGQLAAAVTDLASLRTMIMTGLPGITPDEEIRLLAVLDFLEPELAAIQTVHGAVPVPVISWPADGADIAGAIDLQIHSTYPAGNIHRVLCETRDPITGNWLILPAPAANPSPGVWLQPIDTHEFPDGIRDFRITLTDERMAGPDDDRSCQAVVALRIDNTPPEPPNLLAPAAGQSVGGMLHVEATADTPDAWVASVELSANGVDWTEVATDYHAPDGWMFAIDTSGLAGGAWWLRVTCSDPAENSTSTAPVQVIVLPSYPSWRLQRGITSDNDDADGDTIPAILEYYADLDPEAWNPPSALQMGIEQSGADFFLRCRRRQYYDGISAVVETSTDLGITDPWTPFAYDPPQDGTGRIQVLLPSGPRQFGRMVLQP